MSHLKYLQSTKEYGRAPYSFSLFLNYSVESLSLISLVSLFQGRRSRNKSKFISCQVEKNVAAHCNIRPNTKPKSKVKELTKFGDHVI